MLLAPQHYSSLDAPTAMKLAAKSYETKFGIQFSSITYFEEELLSILHQRGAPEEIERSVTIGSNQNIEILKEIRILTNVANTPNISSVHRAQYRSALESVYRMLPNQPDHILDRQGVLCVGIEREGRILAESMGWMSRPDAIRPEAKRIPYKHGLLVGVSAIPPLGKYSECVIIDGAIASGATLVAVMVELSKATSVFHIFSVHSTAEGLRAILRCAATAGLTVNINVGCVSDGINDHFYAIDPGDPTGNRVMVGDLGDTISG